MFNLLTSIQSMNERGIMTGVGSFRFAPDKPITRAEIATILVRTFQLSSDNSTQIDFIDVPSNYWASSFIRDLVFNNITAGCSTNPPKFCPNKEISNEEISTLIIKSWQKLDSSLILLTPDIPTYADMSTTHWAYPYIETLVAKGVKLPCSQGESRICPTQKLTRGEVAFIMSGILDELDTPSIPIINNISSTPTITFQPIKNISSTPTVTSQPIKDSTDLTTLAKPTIVDTSSVNSIADLNSDGSVTILDFSIFTEYYKDKDLRADLNSDGIINMRDFAVFVQEYNQ